MSTTTIPTVPEVLRGAADLISKHDFLTGEWTDVDGCLCTLAAIARACGLSADDFGDQLMTDDFPRMSRAMDAVDALAAHLGISLPLRESRPRIAEWWRPVTDWSDLQTAPVVIRTLRECAEGVTTP